MKLAGIDIGIFVCYMVIVLGVGLYAARKVARTKRDYFLAGDKMPWWMVGGSIVAANISSHHFVAVMGTAYSCGFPAMTIEWGAILIGFNALLWIFLPFYLRNGFYTMPEFLLRRFSSAARTAFACLILLTYVFVEISAVLYLGSVVFKSLLGVDYSVSIVLLAIFTGLYTITGGLRAVIWTEMLQLVVLLAGGIALSAAVLAHPKVGGWHGVMEMQKTWHLLLPSSDQNFPWTMFLGGLASVSIFYCAANQFIVQRVLAAKNEWHARMGVVFTDYLKFVMPLIILVPGMLAPKLIPHLESPDFVFPTLVATLLPSGLIGLVLAGLIAAIMSHISGALNSCTTIATVDIYLPYIRKDATERQSVRFGRLVGVAILIISIFWARVLVGNSKQSIFLYLLNAYGYFTPGIAAMFLLGVFWKRATNAGALAAGALTIPLTVILEKVVFKGMPFWNRTGIVFWACILVGVVVSLLTKPRPEEEIKDLIWSRESLTLPKEQRAQMAGARNPALWWAIVTAVVLFMYVRYR